MIKKFWKYRVIFFLLFLISFGIFLRFNNLPNLYIFGFDEEYQANYAMTLVQDFHPIWIGVSASFLDFYLGPYFTYFTAFWLMLSRGDPLLTAYVAGVVGVITSVVVFFVGWKFFNLITGIVSSLLYAGLPLIVFYDQKYWNPMFVQLIVLLMFVSLIMIRKSPWWWLFFTAMVGIIFETDLAPFPLVLIGVYFFIKGKYFLNKKLFISCILVFLLFYWPLMVFDYYHNFSNLMVLSRYSEQAKQAGVKFDPVNKFISVLDTIGRFWYLAPGKSNADELNIACSFVSAKPEFRFINRYSERTNPPFWLWGSSMLLLFYFLVVSVKSTKSTYRLLGYFLLVSLVFYIIYSGGSFEYYLHGLVTLFTIVVGVTVSKFNGKIRLASLILLVVVLSLGAYTVLKSSDKFSLGPKKRLIGKVMEKVGSDNFSIEGMGICHNWEGWRYLFKIYGRTPSKSYTDQNFGWLYPDELNSSPIIYNVILSESRIPPERDLNGYYKINEGGYTAYIKQYENLD